MCAKTKMVVASSFVFTVAMDSVHVLVPTACWLKMAVAAVTMMAICSTQSAPS